MKTLTRPLLQPPKPGHMAAAGRFRHGRSPYRQRGMATLFFALIALVILLIGSAIVMHSVNSSLFSAGNLAFRRDLVTQSDTVVAKAIQTVANAGGAGAGGIPDLTVNQPAFNYSATVLSVNQQGIPLALLDDSTFTSVGTPANDVAGAANSKVTIRYLIERMCNAPGAASHDTCVQTMGSATGGGGTARPKPPPEPPGSTIYRLSARVSGPRGTQAFFQTMFSGPS